MTHGFFSLLKMSSEQIRIEKKLYQNVTTFFSRENNLPLINLMQENQIGHKLSHDCAFINKYM